MSAIHLLKVYDGILSEITACGKHAWDLEENETTTHRRKATCDHCRDKQTIIWGLKDCYRCHHEFAFQVKGNDRTGPVCCRPCAHDLDARKHERAAAKARAKVGLARAARDRQVARVKARGWTTKRATS